MTISYEANKKNIYNYRAKNLERFREINRINSAKSYLFKKEFLRLAKILL